MSFFYNYNYLYIYIFCCHGSYKIFLYLIYIAKKNIQYIQNIIITVILRKDIKNITWTYYIKTLSMVTWKVRDKVDKKKEEK